MTKELEKAGIPTVQYCNMTPVADSVGVNRVMQSASIKYPFGNPGVPPDIEYEERVSRLRSALMRLTTP